MDALAQVLRELPPIHHERLIVGTNAADDAGVFLIDDDRALVQTIDVFTPIVDDPRMYGRIAAANALSDVYAMGGRPLTALNFVGFPFAELDRSVLTETLLGGMEKLAEADCVLVGGHTVDDLEFKYGMAITGEVDPRRMLCNAGACPGDRLILTKPLGTGIVTTAVRADIGRAGDLEAACESMTLLNGPASRLAVQHGATACTDVTGFGLIGHAYRMAVESGVSFRIDTTLLSLLPGLDDYVAEGCLTGGGFKNREFVEQYIAYQDDIDDSTRSIIADPQTSGGLLITCPADRAEDLLAALESTPLAAIEPAIIGEVIEGDSGTLLIA